MLSSLDEFSTDVDTRLVPLDLGGTSAASPIWLTPIQMGVPELGSFQSPSAFGKPSTFFPGWGSSIDPVPADPLQLGLQLGAPAPASALLSSPVVKIAFVLVVLYLLTHHGS